MSRPKYTIGETVTVIGLKGAIVGGRIIETFAVTSSEGRHLGYTYNLSLSENSEGYVAAYEEDNLNFYIKVDDDGVALGVDVDE